jgi:hypothetical protein
MSDYSVSFAVLGMALAIVVISYKRGYISIFWQYYRERDKEEVTLDTLIFISSPFLFASLPHLLFKSGEPVSKVADPSGGVVDILRT